jgi:DNA (cytosine-5)-methyltransferase 1
MLIRITIRNNIIAGAIFKILSRSFYAEILALQGFPAGLRDSYFIRDNFGYSEIQDNQTFSTAGRQRGFHDERYLWPEMLRVIRELQPRWVLGENVAGFLRMGLDKTLIDLEQAGYDVRVFVLPAAAVGAWHERKRVFIIGSAASHTPCQRHRGCGQGAGHPNLCEWQLPQDEQGWQGVDGAAFPCGLPHDPHHAGKALPQPGLGRVADGFPAQMDGHSLWAEEPADIPRLTEEVPNRSKRMKTLGNAVSPPQVFPILKYIADIETGRCPMGGEEP